MNENGIVVAIVNSTARVEMVRSPACKTCGLCTSSLDLRKMVIEVKTVPNIRVGDRVVVEIKPESVILSASILYLIPLGGLFLGVVLGQSLFHREGIALLFGLFGLVISFGLVFLFDRKFKKSRKFEPQIVKVIK